MISANESPAGASERRDPLPVPDAAGRVVQAPSHNDTGQRPAGPHDPPCPCGVPAVVVFQTDLLGDMPWCGQSEGAEKVPA